MEGEELMEKDPTNYPVMLLLLSFFRIHQLARRL
jgi:hypothetical protein